MIKKDTFEKYAAERLEFERHKRRAMEHAMERLESNPEEFEPPHPEKFVSLEQIASESKIDTYGAIRHLVEKHDMENKFQEIVKRYKMSQKSSESLNTFRQRVEAKVKEDFGPKIFNKSCSSEAFLPPRIPYKSCSFATREETRMRFVEEEKSYLRSGYSRKNYETFINGMIVMCDEEDIIEMKKPYPDFMDMLKEI